MIETPTYFTLKNFVKFLETYQPEGKYPYDDGHACAIAHFMMQHEDDADEDVQEPVFVNKGRQPKASADGGRTFFLIPAVFNAIAKEGAHTYPEALKRAQQALLVEMETV
jgi:hypothetical protein